MRLSNDSCNIVMNVNEHNHFFKLCQDARVIIITENGGVHPLVVNMHHVTYTPGMVKILVNINYVRSNFNLLLLHYYVNEQKDEFMDRLKELMQEYNSLVNC